MHAYGHQWSCQLVYSPRFQAGLGLSDGEGTERTWNKMRIIIAVTRTSGVCFFLCETGLSLLTYI